MKSDDILRSFGMSGLLVTQDLTEIASRYNIELGHSDHSGLADSTEYYPQFEQTVRAEAGTMARHYELFYCLEQSIRNLISETLSEAKGQAWWDSGLIPANIVNDVKDRVQRELDSGVTRRSDSAIDYTTFGELSVIISSNWSLFELILKSRRAVERVLGNLNVLRGPIAHCCPISEDEVVRLRLTVRDWFRMIG
jgi:hypothetical protein